MVWFIQINQFLVICYNPHFLQSICPSVLILKRSIMNPICSINQAIKQFKGDLKRISAYCKERGIKISQKALEVRIKSH